MTNEEKVKYWVYLSDNDMDTAEVLVKNNRNLHAGFMCQQAVEKIFKGYFAKVKDEVPPFIHDLSKIAERAGFYDLLNDDQISLLEELNPLYIEARYSSYKAVVAEAMTNDKTQKMFEKTKELLQWMKEKM